MQDRRAYRIEPGSIDSLIIRNETLPPPGQGEITIEIHAIGLNFADLYTVWGMYKAAPKSDFIPGLEYAGVVAATGDGVTQWQPGDRVMGITRFGAYTDFLNIDERYVVKIPDDWSMQEGAGFLVQVLTAYYGLVELARIQRNETVLIHSAAGGVGIQAGRIAKKFEAFTIGTIGSPAKLETLQREGFDRSIVRSRNFKADLDAALDGRPLNIIMECIGGHILKMGFHTLAPQGRMIVYGNASFTTHGNKPNKLRMLWRFLGRPKIDPLFLPNSNRSVMGFNLIWLYNQTERFTQIMEALRAMQLPPPQIGERYPFGELQDALRALQSGRTTGKVVVDVVADP